jgi:haloacetate dehalogenase
VLVLWGETDAASRGTRCLEAWKQWADNVTGVGLECGHFLPEEAPEALLARLEPFLERALIQ